MLEVSAISVNFKVKSDHGRGSGSCMGITEFHNKVAALGLAERMYMLFMNGITFMLFKEVESAQWTLLQWDGQDWHEVALNLYWGFVYRTLCWCHQHRPTLLPVDGFTEMLRMKSIAVDEHPETS